MELFQNISTVQIPKVNQTEYYKQLSKSKFVLSPPGHGVDCHRTYESMFFGAIPIVAYNKRMKGIFDIAPVYVNDDWTNPPQKETFINFTLPTTSRKVLLAQYWFDLIDSYRNK